MNPLFNTIRGPRLRQVLESDYTELHVALKDGLSKAGLVLAGGIVAAVWNPICYPFNRGAGGGCARALPVHCTGQHLLGLREPHVRVTAVSYTHLTLPTN